MATITLYKDKINGVGSLLDDIIKSSNNLNAQLGTLKNTLQGVDSSTCNLQDTVDSISSSSKSEKDKVEDLKRLNGRLTEFIEMTTRRDASAKSEIERAKKDFYTKYSYLKPECEKSRMEKIVDAMKKACEWCKEHWKLLVTIVIVAVSIVLLCTGVGAILAGACWGAILGAVIGGVSGGLDSMARGGSFLDGFEEGAFSGAITGAITGAAFAGLGQLGAALGKGIKCASTLGKFVKGTAAVTKVISTAMGGFDTIALLDKAFGTGDIAALNAKLHESKAYNYFQVGVSAVAVLTNGMTSTMKCFVAGTLVLTANGLIAIEYIKSGDLVYAADENSLEVSLQPVLETYVRETSNLIYITVNGEDLISTFDHPYFVKGKGFVSAEKLWIGAELVDNNGDSLCVEQIFRKVLDNQPRTVYNFKVDACHTYFVGKNKTLVHNAEYGKSDIITDGSQFDENGDLKPNVKYQSGEHDYVYETDQNGHIKSVHADEVKSKTHSGRLKHESNTPGKMKGDDAGHLIADRNGGSPRKDNIISQDSHLNRSDYKKMENHFNKAIDNGQKVTDFNIELKNSPSGRPTSIKVDYKVDGEQFKYRFKQ